MSSQATTNEYRSIRQWSRATAWVCMIAPAVFILGTIYQWLAITPEALQAWLNLRHPLLSPERRMASLAVALLPPAILSFGLLRLKRSFDEFAQGHLFTQQSTEGLRAFAAAAVISTLVALAVTPLICLILTTGQPGGTQIAVNIGSEGVTLLLIAGITWVFAHLLELGAKLSRERESLEREIGAFV